MSKIYKLSLRGSLLPKAKIMPLFSIKAKVGKKAFTGKLVISSDLPIKYHFSFSTSKIHKSFSYSSLSFLPP